MSVDGGAAGTFVDADTAHRPLLLDGFDDPVFRFVVKNTGNVALGVSLSDPTRPSTEAAIRASGRQRPPPAGADEFSCEVTVHWAAGQQTNTASASDVHRQRHQH